MPKRRLVDIGEKIYNSLKERPKTVSEISKECNIGWTTVNNHLEYMEMLKKVKKTRTRNVTVWEIV